MENKVGIRATENNIVAINFFQRKRDGNGPITVRVINGIDEKNPRARGRLQPVAYGHAIDLVAVIRHEGHAEIFAPIDRLGSNQASGDSITGNLLVSQHHFVIDLIG